MRNIAVVIPARLNSTRIKHKMLKKFGDEPLIRIVFDKVRMMGFDTFVATDSKRIAKHIPIKWCIQTGKADNGTHRLSKRAVLDLVSGYDYILNIQGDMIDINHETIKPGYHPYMLKAYRTMKDKYKSENLEQNRILANYDIEVIETKYNGIEINTEADLNSWKL